MATRDGRDAEGPADGPILIESLEAIAREAGRRWPWLAPNGGGRWTAEDDAFAISILVEETRARGFLKARDAGMTRAQEPHYLLKALHSRLSDHAERGCRIVLLEGQILDKLRDIQSGPSRLEVNDAAILALSVLAKLREKERVVLAERLLSDVRSRPGQQPDRRVPESSRRTKAYRWARVREVFRAVARQAELNRDEMLDLLKALAAKLTSGGAD